MRCALLYGSDVASLVHRLKFHGDLAAGRALGTLLAASAWNAPRPDCLVPVPLHRARLRERGYNQAGVIAEVVGACLGLPVDHGLITRTRDTQPQSVLTSPGARRRNLRGAFAATGRCRRLRLRRLALIDDVLTTGATAAAATRALSTGAAARVEVWCCARVAPSGGSGV